MSAIEMGAAMNSGLIGPAAKEKLAKEKKAPRKERKNYQRDLARLIDYMTIKLEILEGFQTEGDPDPLLDSQIGILRSLLTKANGK